MSAELPPMTPSLHAKVEQLHHTCAEVLDRYVAGFELDMNRHAVKHGPMPPDRAHNDLTRILAKAVPANMLAGLLAEAILRGIAKKREGKG